MVKELEGEPVKEPENNTSRENNASQPLQDNINHANAIGPTNTALPNNVTETRVLRNVFINSVEGFDKLVSDHEEQLSIKELEIRNVNITAIPEGFLSNCPGLEEVKITHCDQLERFPADFLKDSLVTKFSLSNLKSLKEIPQGFLSNCSKLAYVNIGYCNNLKSFPENFLNGSSVKTIFLFFLESLKEIPEGFLSNCPGLEEVYIANCDQLESLPINFLKDSLIKKLDLCSNKKLAILPEGFLQGCTQIAKVDLSYCLRLQNIPQSLFNLPNACEIDLTGCDTLSRNVRNSIREIANRVDYNGPRFSYSIPEPRGDSKPSEEILKDLHKINGTNFEELKNIDINNNIGLESWLNRLSYTADFKNNESQKGIVKKILDYLELADKDENFRNIFNTIIDGASSSCGDRVSLSILDIGIVKKIFEMKQNQNTTDKEFAKLLIRGGYVRESLENAAVNKMQSLGYVDQIEVFLGFFIKLKDKLNIPIDVNEMLYFGCSCITEKDLDRTENFIKDSLKHKENIIGYLTTNANWKDWLQARYKKEYDDYNKYVINNFDDYSNDANWLLNNNPYYKLTTDLYNESWVG